MAHDFVHNRVMRSWMLIALALAALSGIGPVAGAGEAAPAGARVSLSATAETMLPNDEAVVHFRIEATGKDASALRARVNRMAANIHKRLARERGVTLETTARRLEPVREYDAIRRRQVRTGWRMVQEGRAVSRDLGAVPAWVDAIEKAGAHLSALGYRVSRAARRRALQRLEMEAVRAFRRKAAALAGALDARGFRIVRLNTRESMPAPVVRPMALMKAAERTAPPPALAPGQGRVSVTVSGEIELPPHDFRVK